MFSNKNLLNKSSNDLISPLNYSYSIFQPSQNENFNYLKIRFRFLISIIILIFMLFFLPLKHYGINSLNSSYINENEFNLTKYRINSTKCLNKEYISKNKRNEYIQSKNYFEIINKISNYIIYINILFTFVLMICLYIIIKLKVKYNVEEISKNFKEYIFILSCIINFIDYILLLLLILLYMNIQKIINFITFNINNKCIVMLTWNFTLEYLYENNKFISILLFFRLIILVLGLYLTKSLFIFNNYYIDEEEDELNKDNNNNNNNNIQFFDENEQNNNVNNDNNFDSDSDNDSNPNIIKYINSEESDISDNNNIILKKYK